jgi:hypothetical protein
MTQALFTKPERRQRVQTCMVLGVPSTITLTLRMLGFCWIRALRETWERVMLIFLPKNMSFSQTWHLDIRYTSIAPT